MSKFLCLPKEWREVAVGTVAEVIDPHPSHRAPNEDPLGIPFAGIGDLDEYGRVREDKVRKVSHEIFEEHIKRYKITANSIGFGRVASLGKIIDFKVFKRKVTISPTMAIVEPRGGMSKSFLVHCLRSQETEGQINFFLTGSTRSSLGIALLRNLLVPEPPLPEQKKIAAILSSVDEVIEKTCAQIDKLKDLKTGMMQELLTKGIGHTEFKDSPVGRVPAGWKITKLGSIVAPKGLQTGPFGSQLHAHEYVEWGVPVIMPRDMKGSRVYTGSVAYISEQRAAQLAKHRVRYGDILFARRGEIGRFALIEKANEGWICGTGCLKARFEPSIDPVFISCYLMQPPVIDWLNTHAVGQTMLNLNTSILAELPIILPPEGEQKTIGGAISALGNQINLGEKKVASLVKHKRALMQDLLTGKVRVQIDTRELAEA